MADPIGPVFEGNIEEFVVNEGGNTYRILYLPDKNNDELQRQGKSPYYYWMPKDVRIARNTINNDYKFNLLHFVGVQSEDANVGVEGTREVAGGVLSLTTTAEPPSSVLEKSHEQLRQKFQGSDNRYWGWRTPVAPKFGVMPIAESLMSISNLSPLSDGSIPVPNADTNSGVIAPGTATPKRRSVLDSQIVISPRTIKERDLNIERSNLDAWYVKMEGQGPGSIDAAAEHAFTALLGSYPTAILWQGFKGAYSPVSVTQSMKIKVWSQNVHLKITGNWDSIFQHFSANASGKLYWFSADIKAQFNQLIINGGITVDLMIDGTTPTADKLRDTINKHIEMILEKFMKVAETRIFEPAPPEVKPADASTGGWLSGLVGGGAGFALNYRRDETQIKLNYEENINERYLLNHTISSTLEGFFNEIKADPMAEKKYFTTLYLSDWDRKVSRVIKPVVNWPDLAKHWVGEPVAFLSCQIGYPNVKGELQWIGQTFQEGKEQIWKPAIEMKSKDNVVNPPDGWEPSKTYVKRKIHFLEPPSETENPYMRVFVEKNEVDLDPEGYITDDITLEIRVDSVGKLDVGPIFTNVKLENSNQYIEVSFKALGKTFDGQERPVTRFAFNFDDQDTPRYWSIFTGQPNFIPQYQYQVRVVVKGSIFTKGMEWTGPWNDMQGNGPIMVSVPTPEEAVTKRNLTLYESAMTGPQIAVTDSSSVTKPASEIIGAPTTSITGSVYSGIGDPASALKNKRRAETEPTDELSLVPGWHF